MHIHRLFLVWAGSIALVATTASFAIAQDPPPGPGKTLLRSEPFDRITLIDGTVLLVDPVSPRPLPVVDPAKERERKRKQESTGVPEEGNIIPGKATNLDRIAAKAEKIEDKVRLHALKPAEGEISDFEVKRADIKRIEYFEDMLLEDVDRLVLARDFAQAFECCLWVKSRDPKWPGVEDRVNQILFAEGSRALIEGDDERGQRLLRELLARKADYPGLIDLLSSAYAKRITRSIDLGYYSKGRRILHELENFAPKSLATREMRARFVNRATNRLDAAEGKDPATRLDAMTEALRIWPTLEGVEARYRELFSTIPTLEVAVVDVPVPLGPYAHSPADLRTTRLIYRPLLEDDDDASRQGKRSGQLAQTIELSDLGRRMMIKLRSDVSWSDGSRTASAVDVARDLTDRTDPNSPRYIARWAELLDRVEATDDSRLEIRLNRPPLRAGPWFLGPVGAAHAGADGREASSSPDRPWVCDGPFTAVLAQADRVEFRRSQPGKKVMRIRELRQPSPAAGLAALRHGDVSMLARVSPDQALALAAEPGIKVGAYNRATVHVIALDGRNPALRLRTLRRALSYAIDRKGLLEELVLKRPIDDVDRPADGPFPKGSYADAPGVQALEYNPMLAKMLTAAARKEIGGSPIQLKLEHPPSAEARAVVGKLVFAFKSAGVEVEAIEVGESQLESELRAGRKFDMAYRAVRLDEPASGAGPLLVPGYDAPPAANCLASAASPRILQLLLALERTVDWPSARGLTVQIDRESRDELPVIPLWQIVDHYAWRDRLKGPAKTANRLYDQIETWEIAPWVAKDPTSSP